MDLVVPARWNKEDLAFSLNHSNTCSECLVNVWKSVSIYVGSKYVKDTLTIPSRERERERKRKRVSERERERERKRERERERGRVSEGEWKKGGSVIGVDEKIHKKRSVLSPSFPTSLLLSRSPSLSSPHSIPTTQDPSFTYSSIR